MLEAKFNFPPKVECIRSLVVDESDLQLMLPTASLPFDATQWSDALDPKKGSLSFLVKQNGDFVGHFAFLRVNHEPSTLTLGLVYLVPTWRGKGLSKKMIALAEHIAVNFVNAKVMHLNVRSFNSPALKLYMSMDYAEYERSDNLIQMKKSL